MVKHTFHGKMLISTPKIKSGIFHKSIIYVYDSNERGTQGILLNRPLDPKFSYPWARQIGWNYPDKIYDGGPLEKSLGYIIHSSDYAISSSVHINEYILYNDKQAIVAEIGAGAGPKNFLLMTGYCAWESKQLESEIANGLWIVTDFDLDFFFQDVVNDLGWQQAIHLAASNESKNLLESID
jgi:putative transcriptional regulator